LKSFIEVLCKIPLLYLEFNHERYKRYKNFKKKITITNNITKLIISITVKLDNFKLIKLEYVKDNEFILAIYEKINEKNNYKFNYKNEKKIIKKIYKKYLIRYIWNSIFVKFLKLSKIDESIRKLYRNIKNLF